MKAKAKAKTEPKMDDNINVEWPDGPAPRIIPLMCLVGFHGGVWNKPYVHTTSWVDEKTGKITHETTQVRQARLCPYCRSLFVRKVW